MHDSRAEMTWVCWAVSQAKQDIWRCHLTILLSLTGWCSTEQVWIHSENICQSNGQWKQSLSAALRGSKVSRFLDTSAYLHWLHMGSKDALERWTLRGTWTRGIAWESIICKPLWRTTGYGMSYWRGLLLGACHQKQQWRLLKRLV